MVKVSLDVRTRPLTLEMSDEFNAALQKLGAEREFGMFDMDSMTGVSGIACDVVVVEQVKKETEGFVEYCCEL